MSLLLFNLIAMFRWFSHCWNGMGIKTSFERSRVRSVIADWNVPQDEDLIVLINSFKGMNPELPAFTALNLFFTGLETEDERENSQFLLKHLYILDHTVEEGVALKQISGYYCSLFFNFHKGGQFSVNPLRQLISAYFLYIKKKAVTYIEMDPNLLNNKYKRVSLIESYTLPEIFKLVQKCLQTHHNIKQLNSSFKQGKNVYLIQQIFIMLLRNQLFCYNVISICVKICFRRLNQMMKAEIVEMIRILSYFNKDYILSFVEFVEANKEIQAFKKIKYSELTHIDKSIIKYLEGILFKMDNNQIENLYVRDFVDEKKELTLKNLPKEIIQEIDQLEIKRNGGRFYQTKLEDVEDLSSQFYDYQNTYHEQYENELQKMKREEYSKVRSTSPLKSQGYSPIKNYQPSPKRKSSQVQMKHSKSLGKTLASKSVINLYKSSIDETKKIKETLCEG